MVTEEALAERKAALEGDPGTDAAHKVAIPEDHPVSMAKPVQQPDIQTDAELESRVHSLSKATQICICFERVLRKCALHLP